MKKIIVILMLLPIFVYAETCEIVSDNQTTYDRNLVCDATNKTTTLFKTNNDEVLLENSVCKVSCSEEILFSVDPIKKVLAGTSFSYPLYASGERTCTATYKYNAYESKIKQLVIEYNSLNGTEKATKGNELRNFYAQKKACDEFVEEEAIYANKYKFNADVNLKIETSERVITVPYKYIELEEYSNMVLKDDVPYLNACNYNETTKECMWAEETDLQWVEYSRIYGKYTMNDSYVEKYTGEIKSTASDNTCNAGDRYFVSLNEFTRPESDDSTDKGYSLTLIANNIGTLGTTGSAWKLNVDCWYQVKNLIFPQTNIGGKTDELYEKIGGTGFMYRIIDLNNPFPDREPGANWIGKESIITSTKDNLNSLQKFVINLSSSSIGRIRTYNNVHSYEPFNIEKKEINGVEKEYSSFIEAFDDVIDRK